MEIRTDVDIVRHEDGTLTVPVAADRHDDDEGVPSGPSTVTLSPGEGGYDEALSHVGPAAGSGPWRRGVHPVGSRGGDGGGARRRDRRRARPR